MLAQEDDSESGAPAAAEAAPGDYQQALAPYGAWVDDGSYGDVWRPPVDEDWQPYVDGSWSWTGDGWTWESDEPWGWTFHYGRWALSPVFGWVWVPGDAWGPAWVDWFSGDGFVGWAPLSPFGGVVVSNFVFVNEANFCDPNLKHAVLGGNRVPRLVIDDPGARHRRPDLGHIARVTHHPVRLEGKPHQTLAPWDRRGESLQPRSAGLRQPEASPPGIATTPLALDSPAAGLDARGGAGPRTHRLGRPVLGGPSPAVPPLSVAVPARQFGAPGLAPRRPTAPGVAFAHAGGASRPGKGFVSPGAGFTRSRAGSQRHAARLGGTPRR